MTAPSGPALPWWRRLLGGGSRIDPVTALELQRDGAVLLDVRERPEWSAGHAPKARHIPLGELDRRRREIATGRTVLTVCRSGARSARAAAALRRAGFTVLDVKGGMRAWDAAGLPMTASGGRPGRVA